MRRDPRRILGRKHERAVCLNSKLELRDSGRDICCVVFNWPVCAFGPYEQQRNGLRRARGYSSPAAAVANPMAQSLGGRGSIRGFV